jgi:hypothetical protein
MGGCRLSQDSVSGHWQQMQHGSWVTKEKPKHVRIAKCPGSPQVVQETQAEFLSELANLRFVLRHFARREVKMIATPLPPTHKLISTPNKTGRSPVGESRYVYAIPESTLDTSGKRDSLAAAGELHPKADILSHHEHLRKAHGSKLLPPVNYSRSVNRA